MHVSFRMSASPHNIILTAAQRKVVAELLPKLADRMNLEEKNSRTNSFTTNELESIRNKAREYDPEKFDAAKTTKVMRLRLPDWRQHR